MQNYKVSSEGEVSNHAVQRTDFLDQFINIPPH